MKILALPTAVSGGYVEILRSNSIADLRSRRFRDEWKEVDDGMAFASDHQ